MRNIDAINWNRIEDEKDKIIWDRLISNFWVDTKIPLSNDIPSFRTLTEQEKTVLIKAFGGLTLLDTIQSFVGAPELSKDAITPHEEAVFSYISFNESIHAKSYSSIFSTLYSTVEIDGVFRWLREDENVLLKKSRIMGIYEERLGGDSLYAPWKKKIASVFLESFLFYTGFYLPLYWASRSKLTNTADIIRLIMRDEALHGYYIGYKFQQSYNRLDANEKELIKEFAYELLMDLYHIEEKYTEYLYDEVGMTEDVKAFLRYNGNKALQNLGFDALFAEESTKVSPSILASLSAESDETHDFFSGAGSSYKIGVVEATQDDDWDF